MLDCKLLWIHGLVVWIIGRSVLTILYLPSILQHQQTIHFWINHKLKPLWAIFGSSSVSCCHTFPPHLTVRAKSGELFQKPGCLLYIGDEVLPSFYGDYNTLPETNMAPENRPSQEQISSSNHPSSGAMLVLGSVSHYKNPYDLNRS